MKNDRFLLIILAGIGVLVVTAILLFFSRRDSREYGPEDTPQGVIRNYVLALEKRDYVRAYSYLGEGENKPDFDTFRQDFLTRRVDPSSAAVVIGDELPSGDETVVDLVIVYSSSGPFADSYREPAQALLTHSDADEWKILRLPYPYWGYAWYEEEPGQFIEPRINPSGSAVRTLQGD